MVQIKDECKATWKAMAVKLWVEGIRLIINRKALENWSTACHTLLNAQLIWDGQILNIHLMRLTVVNRIANPVQTEV